MPAVVDAAQQAHQPSLQSCHWNRFGPLHATCHLEANYPTLRGLRLTIVLQFWNNTGLIRSDICWHNPHRARHSGGLWDLGDAGSIFLRDASWRVELSQQDPAELTFQTEPRKAWKTSNSVVIHQESSGGEHWNSINHVDRTGVVPMRYRGYQVTTPTGVETGLRATPAVCISGQDYQISATIPLFWQQFPKSLSATSSEIVFGLFPSTSEQLFELQGGERKTQTVWLELVAASTSAGNENLTWVHDPPRLIPVLDQQPKIPGWPSVTNLASDVMARIETICDESLNGPASVFTRREEIDEYGWRNFGDFYADHESAYYRGEHPLISHYNNQYDVLGGLLLQGLQTSQSHWWELADALQRHITDIDMYHTQEDRSVYNGGLFWLTDHYVSCGTATHRTFSRQNAPEGKPYGGGPGCEHNYSTGILATYWLTGEPTARQAVIQLAEWVIAMDDGRQTIFGLVDDGPTGSATSTTNADYQGPGRGAGNSINTLLDAWLLSGDRHYLQTAETFIARCIHPEDDIAERDLLNFELRWSYTVFLMAVFKYLECKAELHEFDERFAYARQSLLHYAKWMFEHEEPYFDHPEKMEYPTETWAAQELRKANVLRWAARYTEDRELRTRLHHRGDELAERAWHDLHRFPTRAYLRPFTLVMIQGLWDAALRTDETFCAERGPAKSNWGVPQPFLTQKNRVKRLWKSPGGICTALWHMLDPRRWLRFVDAVKRLR